MPRKEIGISNVNTGFIDFETAFPSDLERVDETPTFTDSDFADSGIAVVYSAPFEVVVPITPPGSVGNGQIP